jgi:DNA repair protein RecO (recombination protein O)
MVPETPMPQEKSEALVLRGVDFGETSRIVTFLTPHRGRMACLAKGVRRRNSPLAAALDAFNRVELVYYWKDGRQVQQLGEVSVLDAFAGLKRDLERSTFAAFPVEIAARTAHENEPSEDLYVTLVRGLSGLDVWTGDPRAHCCWQAMRLLCVAGFAPNLSACVHCGVDVAEPRGFAYAGGVACPGCPADLRLTGAALAGLRAAQSSVESCPTLPIEKEVFHLLRRFAARQLDTEFRSIRVIESMFG